MASPRKPGAGKKEEDPEAILKRKFRYKCRFRGIVRLAHANAYWLYEESEDYEGVDDVKKRVAQAMRAKKKDLLSLTDKALLNKPAQDRTDQEKVYIYRIIGGLKCFKRYPNNVKRKLAAVTYFKYYGPNRVIVRQNHEAFAMYFIVTGDIAVSQMVFDDLLKKEVSVELGVMHPGDLFGEVSLLHNIPRTATCTTVGHCELLALMSQDFKNVLQATIQASWDEVRRAMSYFTYFDSLDEVARREGCIMAKMKFYHQHQTILGDGVGVANFVYFVLSGHCQMIETIKVTQSIHLGRTYYTLYDPYVSEAESDEKDNIDKYFKNLNESDTTKSQAPIDGSSILGGKEVGSTSKCSKIGSKRTSYQTECGSRDSKDIVGKSSHEGRDSKLGSQVKYATTINEEDASHTSAPKLETLLPPSEHYRDSVRYSVVKLALQEPLNLRTYFMQVCQYNPGSTFGFGENMRDRRIVALTNVECMLMPKVWLLQRNTANIWSRIQHFLEKRIPSKKELFKAFVAERRWDEYRDGLVEDIVGRSQTVNWTTVHDVPYSIRMEEMFDV